MTNEPNFDGVEMKIPEKAQAEIATEQKSQTGILTALVLVLGVLLAGLFYWYYVGTNIPPTTPPPIRPPVANNAEPETPTATAQTESFGALSTSDEISALEADIESTNLESLETELLQIDAELNAALE